KCLLGSALFTRLHVETVFFDFFDDVFLLYFALETSQGIFKRLTLLNYYFSHAEFTPHSSVASVGKSALRENSPRKARRCACSSEGGPLSQGIFCPAPAHISPPDSRARLAFQAQNSPPSPGLSTPKPRTVSPPEPRTLSPPRPRTLSPPK